MTKIGSIAFVGIWLIILLAPSALSLWVKSYRHNAIFESLKEGSHNDIKQFVFSRDAFTKMYNPDDRELNFNNQLFDVVKVIENKDTISVYVVDDIFDSAVNVLVRATSNKGSNANDFIPIFDSKFYNGFVEINLKAPLIYVRYLHSNSFYTFTREFSPFHPPEYLLG